MKGNYLKTGKLQFKKYVPIWALKIIAGKKGYSLQKAKEIDLTFASLVAAFMKEILDAIKQQQQLKQLFLYQQWQQSLKELQVVVEEIKSQEVEAAIEIVKQATDGTINEAEIYDLKKMTEEVWAPLGGVGYCNADLQMLEDQIAEVQADVKSDPFAKQTLRQLKRLRTKMINEMKKRAAHEAFKKENNLND